MANNEPTEQELAAQNRQAQEQRIRETTPDAIVVDAKKGADDLATIQERGYRIETWNGLPKYCSIFDGFDTMNLVEIEEYVNNHRGGFGVRGFSGMESISENQRRTASVPAAKKKAS